MTAAKEDAGRQICRFFGQELEAGVAYPAFFLYNDSEKNEI